MQAAVQQAREADAPPEDDRVAAYMSVFSSHIPDSVIQARPLALALMHVPVVSLAISVRWMVPSFASPAHSFDWPHRCDYLVPAG